MEEGTSRGNPFPSKLHHLLSTSAPCQMTMLHLSTYIADDVKDLRDNHLNTPLHLALDSQLDKQVLCDLIPLLVTKKNINHRNLKGQTPLHLLLENNIELVTTDILLLLCSSESINRKYKDHRPINYLLSARYAQTLTESEQLDAVKILIENGASCNLKVSGLSLIYQYLQQVLYRRQTLPFSVDIFELIASKTQPAAIFAAFIDFLQEYTKVRDPSIIRCIVKCFLYNLKPFYLESFSVEMEEFNLFNIGNVVGTKICINQEDVDNDYCHFKEWPSILHPAVFKCMTSICTKDEKTEISIELDIDCESPTLCNTPMKFQEQLKAKREQFYAPWCRKTLQDWCNIAIRKQMRRRTEEDYHSLGLPPHLTGALTLLYLADDICSLIPVYDMAQLTASGDWSNPVNSGSASELEGSE